MELKTKSPLIEMASKRNHWKYSVFAVLLFACSAGSLLLADGKTDACSPPEGTIEVSGNNVTDCDGAKTIAIGKPYTLNAPSSDLEDKDCYCGAKVDDSIDQTTGIQWTIDGNTQTGAQITGTASNSPTSISITLEVDDAATDSETTDDGGFTQVDSVNINVVIPDDATWGALTAIPNFCSGDGQGYHLSDTLSKNNCDVDFSGLFWFEANQVTGNVNNGCGFGPGIIGGGQYIGSGNTATDNDTIGICGSLLAHGFVPANCESSWSLEWKIAVDASSSSHTVITRTYTFTNSSPVVCTRAQLQITVSK